MLNHNVRFATIKLQDALVSTFDFVTLKEAIFEYLKVSLMQNPAIDGEGNKIFGTSRETAQETLMIHNNEDSLMIDYVDDGDNDVYVYIEFGKTSLLGTKIRVDGNLRDIKCFFTMSAIKNLISVLGEYFDVTYTKYD